MVKFLIMDVDGTLTDGKIFIGDKGELFKSFDVKDGCGIKDILPRFDIIPIIITARESKMLKLRCDELGIANVYQGIRDKLGKLTDLLEDYSTDECRYSLKDCAYIGDDVLDLQCMTPIKMAGGIVGCPLDAVDEVKAIANYISPYKAGNGAVRDFISFLTKRIEESSITERVYKAIEYVSRIDIDKINPGTYSIDDKTFYMVQSYNTKKIEDCRFESHKRHVDVQWIVEGTEKIGISTLNGLHIEKQYDEDKDVIFWMAPKQMQECVLCAGSYIILYPENGHMPCIEVNGPQMVKKIVIKIEI